VLYKFLTLALRSNSLGTVLDRRVMPAALIRNGLVNFTDQYQLGVRLLVFGLAGCAGTSIKPDRNGNADSQCDVAKKTRHGEIQANFLDVLLTQE
jgi:hypothetical protein